MATGRSFAEFVKDKCHNGLYQTADDYVNENWESMDLYTRNVHRIGHVEMIDCYHRKSVCPRPPGKACRL